MEDNRRPLGNSLGEYSRKYRSIKLRVTVLLTGPLLASLPQDVQLRKCLFSSRQEEKFNGWRLVGF
jgi:hypothetical protein